MWVKEVLPAQNNRIHNSWHGLLNQIIRDLTFLIGPAIRCDFLQVRLRSRKVEERWQKEVAIVWEFF
jgi:hypothetical protein